MSDVDQALTRELEAEEQGLQQALLGADLDWFREHWLPDAMYVHLSGRMDRTEDFVERLRSRASVYNSREIGDVTVRVYDNCGIVTGTSRIDIVTNGTQKLLDTRFTRVYVRKGSRWLLASAQSGGNTA